FPFALIFNFLAVDLDAKRLGDLQTRTLAGIGPLAHRLTAELAPLSYRYGCRRHWELEWVLKQDRIPGFLDFGLSVIPLILTVFAPRIGRGPLHDAFIGC